MTEEKAAAETPRECKHAEGPCECGPNGFGLDDADPRVNALHVALRAALSAEPGRRT